jgi:hypothetical protein
VKQNILKTALLLWGAILLFTTGNLTAQVCRKGTVMLGGTVGFNNYKPDDEDSETFFRLNPNVCFFVTDNVALGGNLLFSTGSDITEIGVGPYVRAYVYDKLFAVAEFSFLRQSFDGEGESFSRFGGGIGYSLFLNDVVAIEPILLFQTGDYILNSDLFSFADKDNLTRIGLNFSVQVFLNRGEKE